MQTNTGISNVAEKIRFSLTFDFMKLIPYAHSYILEYNTWNLSEERACLAT